MRKELFTQLEGYGHGSPQDLQALEDLVQWIRTGPPDADLAAQAPGGTVPEIEARAGQVIELSRVFQARLEDFLRQTEAPRFVEVLTFLAQKGIDGDRLNQAMRSARWKDGVRQLVTSEVGYMSSFGVFNGMMALLMHLHGGPKERLSPGWAALPLFAAPFTAMGAALALRHGEVPNRWTRTVEAGPEGRALPHAQTSQGALKVATQYWGFMGSLSYAAWFARGPLHRVLDRLSGGFVATAFVALHRMVALNVDFPWLKAGTTIERRALLGALRQLAPATRDPERYFPRTDTPAARVLEGLPPHDRTSPCDELGSSTKRILCFFIPLALTFTFFAPIFEDAGEEMTTEQALQAGLAASAGAVVLLALWGPAMAAQERFASTDPSIGREMQARALRRQATLAQTVDPAELLLPPQAAAPQDGAPHAAVDIHEAQGARVAWGDATLSTPPRVASSGGPGRSARVAPTPSPRRDADSADRESVTRTDAEAKGKPSYG